MDNHKWNVQGRVKITSATIRIAPRTVRDRPILLAGRQRLRRDAAAFIDILGALSLAEHALVLAGPV
jgi:hypothetical protein